jgi:hypothetical protein
MKWSNYYRMRFLLIAFLAAIVLGGGNLKADFIFGEPEKLGPGVNSSSGDLAPWISHDNLELYFVSLRSGGSGAEDLWVTTRPSKNEPWGEPVNLGPIVNASSKDSGPSVSADGLELYFDSTRTGGLGKNDIWLTRRATKDEPWSEPVNLGLPVNSEKDEASPCLSANGLELYLVFGQVEPTPELNIAVARRDTKDSPWGEPVSLGPVVNNATCQVTPRITSDSLLLLFSDSWICSSRPGGFGDTDIWLSRRATKDGEWDDPINLGSMINTAFAEEHAMISADGTMLYYDAYHFDSLWEELWQAPIIPIVDLNGDGIVDASDMCIVVDHWGTDDPLCDIGPMPWGDGIVDVEDLKVLAGHLFEHNDPALIAHWALDETEGMFAIDSVGDNDAVVLGGTEWQPTGGQIDGALKLDSVSGYAIAGAVLNPADGPFSIIAWIKGGAPGQVVVSQQLASNWLSIDTEGNLMTELKSSDPLAEPLLSETVITDGQWHRIGLVWDGSHRTLLLMALPLLKTHKMVWKAQEMA